MKKIKLTQEQADAVEEYLSGVYGDREILVSDYVTSQESFKYSGHVAINDLELDTLIKALYIGYEVEEDFKVGDWVTIIVDSDSNNIAYEIHRLEGNLANLVYNDEFRSYWPIGDLRHATPEEIKAEKERKVWAKIGREVGEFREGDAYENSNGLTNVVDNTERIFIVRGLYEKGRIKGIYPAEYFIKFGEED